MQYCLYFDQKSHAIRGFLPSNLDERTKSKIQVLWESEIPRKMLIALSEDEEITTPELQAKIGHSMSTLHENISKLKSAGLIDVQMSYEKNKKKILKTNLLCVTHNPKLTSKLKNFLNKGLWVDSKKSKSIIKFLDEHPTEYFTVPEIASKLKIPADEVATLLSNWESQITRAFSDFLKPVPFEKKVLYKSAKRKK